MRWVIIILEKNLEQFSLGGKIRRAHKRHLKVGGYQQCKSFHCPSVEYNNGSSLDQATKQINDEHSKHIDQENQVSGKAPPAKGA